MSTDEHDHRARWSPRPRPEWVARLNEEGSFMDIRSLVPLDGDSLIATAKANTGLDDFGDDLWREPFEILVKALEDEAHLNLMGRLMTRSDLLIYLQGRLGVEQAYKEHPEIDAEEVKTPLFILGQPRTGTTVLQAMLAEDPDNGTIRTWETLFPTPPPEKTTASSDSRVELADRLMTQWNRVAPELPSMHEFTGPAPTENAQLQCLSFRSPWFNLLGQVPSYLIWLMGQDPALPYQYERRVLKLLQWKNPRKRWVLKNPFSITHMPDILRVYPDAQFVWIHRDPLKAISSVVDLIGTLYWVRSDHPFVGDVVSAMLGSADLAAGMMGMPIDWLETGSFPAGQLCNVHFHEFVKDPVGVGQQIYDAFGMEMTDDARRAMKQYMQSEKQEKRPAHVYELGSGEVIAKDRVKFTRYQEYFGVPSEVE